MIVGMCGAAGSGKDTAAKPLMQYAGFSKASFAKPLKDTLDYLFRWESNWDDLEWKETPNVNAFGHTPRFIAQSFGTDWGRNMISPEIWVTLALAALPAEGNHVFTDVRFPNEAAAIRAAGGILVFVSCSDRASGTNSNQHESEGWLDWLFHYADVDIAAAFGEIDKLQEATLNVVENYMRGDVPRYEPGAEVMEVLNDIERAMQQSNV
jgi:hypothetical protein